MVVHDLKNPVNGIAMLVQLLRRKGPFTAMQQRSLTQIERTCRDLLRLIANVLEIGKIEAGRMPVTLEPIVLAELVDEIAAEYDPVASEVGRRLVIAVGTGGAPAHADRTLLKRVLVNLVVNALRHSGSPEVRIDALSGGRGTDVTLRVTDTGHGIPEDEQAHVFEKFETLRGHTTGDTGLGLHFCKLAVERMGGRITLTSGTGAGTTFAITLPTRGDP
jgi:signal transduction histidine kinase